MKQDNQHPAELWKHDYRFSPNEYKSRLRLAGMAGHMQVDKIAARRGALIDLLSDGCPHPREEIFEKIKAQLDEKCWGKIPKEALARDLKVLRSGGIRIGYSRLPELPGYYLQFPVFESQIAPYFETINWQLIDQIKKLSVAVKNGRSFAAAQFALTQKKLILQSENPDWPSERVMAEAQKIVYGVEK